MPSSLALRGLRAHRGPTVGLRALKEHRVHKALRGTKDQLARKGHRVELGHKVTRVRRVLMVGHKVHRALRVQLVLRVRRVFKGAKALREHRVSLELLVHRVARATRDTRAIRVSRATRVLRVQE